LSDAYQGLHNEDATLRKKGELKATQGKEKMPFDLYAWLALYFLSKNDIFSWCYLVICWNLMSRASDVAEIHFSHLTWDGDALGIYMPKSKTDPGISFCCFMFPISLTCGLFQGGVRPKDPFHVYANPLRPAVCPILALGVWIVLTHAERSSPDKQLFPGGSFLFYAYDDNVLYTNVNIRIAKQEARFAEALASAVRTGEGKSQLAAHSLKPDDIGTHSLRKGSSTHTTSGSTVGPNIIAVCQRAGWAYGDVLSRYLRYEGAGDQYVGRVVCGLPVDSASFATLPPHFDAALVPVADVLRFFPSMVSEEGGYNLNEVLRFTLASVILHRQFLSDSLPKKSPFKSSLVMTNTREAEGLAKKIITGYHSPFIIATGIPPHVVLLLAFSGIEIRLKDLPAALAKNIEEILERNGAAAANITPGALYDHLEKGLEKVLEKRFPRLAAIAQPNPIDDVDLPEPKYPLYCWNGQFHALPDDHVLPAVSVPIGWRLWHRGRTRGHPCCAAIANRHRQPS